MRRIRNASLAVLLTLLPAGLVACGGDDDSSGDGVTPAETDEGAPTGDDVGQNDDQNDTLGGEAED